MFLESISYPIGDLPNPWKRFYQQYQRKTGVHSQKQIEQFNRHFKFKLLSDVSENKPFNEEELFRFLSQLNIQVDDWFELEQINPNRVNPEMMDKAVGHMTPLSIERLDNPHDKENKNIRYICQSLIPYNDLSRSEIVKLSDIYKGHINSLDKVIVSELISIVVSSRLSQSQISQLESMTIRVARNHLKKEMNLKTGFNYKISEKFKDWVLLQTV